MINNFQFSIFNFQNKPARKQAGFTIIEVIVSAFVFSIIVVIVSGLFVQILAAERRAFASQKIQENGLFIMELMSREIRVSQIQNQDSPNCTATSLTIIHPVNGPVTYSLTLNDGILHRMVKVNPADADSQYVITNLSSSAVVFSRLNFCVMGSAALDQQVRVTILASIQNKIGPEILTANLETTITSRDVLLKF